MSATVRGLLWENSKWWLRQECSYIYNSLGQIIIIIKSRLYKSTASFSMRDATLNRTGKVKDHLTRTLLLDIYSTI